MELKGFKGEIVDFAKDLVIIILIVLFIRTFLFEPFQISGQSMYASYYDREFIIVDRFSYLDIPYIKTGEIERGDVVVFKPGVSKEKEYFIKRVIGVGGDSIKIEDGEVYLKKSGETEYKLLNESDYLTAKNDGNTPTRGGFTEFEVPEGKYYLVGDNRNASSDSRFCFAYSCSVSKRDAYVNKEDITGKVLLDLGYFNFKELSFTHPTVRETVEENGENVSKPISTSPKWFSSLSTYDYSN